MFRPGLVHMFPHQFEADDGNLVLCLKISWKKSYVKINSNVVNNQDMMRLPE